MNRLDTASGLVLGWGLTIFSLFLFCYFARLVVWLPTAYLMAYVGLLEDVEPWMPPTIGFIWQYSAVLIVPVGIIGGTLLYLRHPTHGTQPKPLFHRYLWVLSGLSCGTVLLVGLLYSVSNLGDIGREVVFALRDFIWISAGLWFAYAIYPYAYTFVRRYFD